ncbi:MAG TPA: DNA repair protein RecN [Candidatus Krumholzibacteria bacterium]|nr:DNA repair protein RecN [Candidatus Krumholzibacteria bacterium]
MLRRLHIENLAVVESATLDFQPGLNVITGSTGAGKSLIVGAVNLLLGEKGSAEAIRSGADEAFVSATFVAPKPLPAALVEASNAQGEIEVTRRISRAGRSSASINDRPVTLRELRARTSALIEPHGQNEQYRLRDPESHVEYIDANAGAENKKESYGLALARWRRARAELERFDSETALIREKSELFAHRIQEIDRIAPRAGEKTELENQARVMANAEKMFSALDEATSVLYDGDSAVAPQVARVRKRLSPLAGVDTRLESIEAKLAEAEQLVRDAAHDATTLRDGLEFEPADVERVQERLDVLTSLERRYKSTIELILYDREKWGTELDALTDSEGNRTALEQEIVRAASALEEAGEALSALRKRVAVKFDETVNAGLARVMMRGARFRTDFTRADVPMENGLDVVRMRVQTNPGEAEGALEEIASTGELSRIALILKPLAGGGGTTLIFDEIDAGVGADMGDVLAEKLLALADAHQIVCITHLPQIAARGINHLVVLKENVKDRTRVRVRAVDGEDRMREIARMLGGSDGSEQRVALARELLAVKHSRSTRARP